jgi:hypothetical protein
MANFLCCELARLGPVAMVLKSLSNGVESTSNPTALATKLVIA